MLSFVVYATGGARTRSVMFSHVHLQGLDGYVCLRVTYIFDAAVENLVVLDYGTHVHLIQRRTHTGVDFVLGSPHEGVGLPTLRKACYGAFFSAA